MDPSWMMILMQMQNYLSHDTSSSPWSSTSSDSSAPLIFLMLTAALSNALQSFQSQDQEDEQDQQPTNNTNEDHTNGIPLRDPQWREKHGISYNLFANLVEQLRPHIPPNELPIPLHHVLSFVLCRLAQGHDPETLAAQHSNVSPRMISRMTNMVTRVIASRLYHQYIRIPTGPRLMHIISAFGDITGLPNMCGAIDGTHVKLSNLPSSDADAHGLYMSRLGFPSVLLQCVCDHDKVFWDVCVKAPGGWTDSAHFAESSLFRKLSSGEILSEPLTSMRRTHIRPFIVGDSCYPLLPFLLTPFSCDGPAETMLDGALMRGRAFVQRAICLLKGRWRILQNLDVGVSHAAQTIVACCILHNMCQLSGEPEVPMFAEPRESGSPFVFTDADRNSHYYGENVRRALLEDLQQDRQQKMEDGSEVEIIYRHWKSNWFIRCYVKAYLLASFLGFVLYGCSFWFLSAWTNGSSNPVE